MALTPITIVSKPQHPKPGESVTLIVQGPPKTIEVCKWFRQTPSGTVQSILTYFTGVKAAPDTGPAHSGRETVQRNCSLYITRLTVSDSGNYSLEIEAPPEGRQFDIEEEEEGQKYKGHVYLRVGHDPCKYACILVRGGHRIPGHPGDLGKIVQSMPTKGVLPHD